MRRRLVGLDGVDGVGRVGRVGGVGGAHLSRGAMSTWVSLIIWLARWAYRVGPRLSGAVSVEARSVALGLRLALWKCGWCLSLAGLACAHSVRFGGGSVPCQDHVSCKKHVQGTEPGRPPDPRPAPPTPPQTPGVEPRSCRTAFLQNLHTPLTPGRAFLHTLNTRARPRRVRRHVAHVALFFCEQVLSRFLAAHALPDGRLHGTRRCTRRRRCSPPW